MKTIVSILIILIMHQLCFGQCPTISKQPSSQIDCEGNSIRMILETNATAVQWERKRPSDGTFSSISGAKSTNYQIYPSGGTSNPDGTIYRAKLTSGSCTIYSDEVSIGLNTITNITGTTICERSDGVLLVNMPENSKNRAQSYQWTSSKNGEPFQDLVNSAEFEGVTTNSLQIKNAGLQHQGQKFKVRINFAVSPNNDNDGSTINSNQTATCPRTSNEVSLTIKTAPIPNHSVESYNACVGSSVSVSSTGCSPYSTLWYNGNNQKVGEGARSLIQFNQVGQQQLFATCLKSGCESLPSNGIEITVNEIPGKVVNTETPTKIKAGENIVFKASGGINNIWYLKGSDLKYVSTASTLTIKNALVENNQPFISRWVSQKVNGCESEKIEIKVMVESATVPEPPIPGPIPEPTPEPPIPLPEPTPEPIPDPIPEPTPPTPEPIIQYFAMHVQKNCEREAYVIYTENCPANVDFYDAESNHYLGYGNTNQAFELDARWYRKIVAKCNSAYFADIYREFFDLKNPEISIIQKAKEGFCSGDTMQLKSSVNYPADFLHWERNGHMYSTANELLMEADSSQFSVLFRKNDCYYRQPAPPIKIYPKPQKPVLKYPKTSFCPGEKLVVQSEKKAHKYLWSNQIQEESNLVTETTSLSLIVQNEFQCPSDNSDKITFTRLPKGEKPIISANKIQFCEGDTVLIESNLKDQTIWNNGRQASFLRINETDEFYAYTKSPEGCLSDYSETIRVIKRANPSQPKITQPFNRVFKGIAEASDDVLEWRVNEQILPIKNNELRLHNPTNFYLNSVKKYTLKGVDLLCSSKKIHYQIKEIDPYKEMVIFPNPSKNFEVQINTPFDFERGTLYLIDLNGHIIFEKAIQNKLNPITQKFTNINPGIYILRIVSEQWTGEKRVFLME